MHRTIDVLVHDDGTLELLEPLGVRGARRAILTILNDDLDIQVRPQSQAPAIDQLLAELRVEGLIGVQEDDLSGLQPLTPAEREMLRQRIPIGTPLSQIIVEDREERF